MSGKLTISKALYRRKRLDIKLDILKDGKEVKGAVVGWVELLGEQDPLYLEKVRPYIIAYKEDLDDYQKDLESALNDKKTIGGELPQEQEDYISNLQLKINELLGKLLNVSVSAALVDWDEDFFEVPFSQEEADKLFSDPQYNHIYNQIALAMKERESFLPSAD